MDMKDLAKKYNLTKDDYWKESRSGKYIITHDSVEKIAKIEKIIINPPQIVNSEKDMVRLIVVAKKGDVVMWADGEADTKNCKNLYLFAMASKRAIDRVVLKLIDAYEYGVFSDVEADDFKKPNTVHKALIYEHRTEDQAKEFEELKEHPAFDNLKKFSNDEWKKCNNIKEYESVLERMRGEREKYDNITNASENQDGEVE